jgi:hypothetical protein
MPHVHDATRRLPALDSLRGGLLVMMAINHVPSDLHVLTDQPLGFVSAAEGFVALAAVLAGSIYSKRVLALGLRAASMSALQRALRIYRAHLICIVLVAAWCLVHLGVTGDAPPGSPLAFTDRPLASPVAAAVFVYRPGLLDILPLYCACFVTLPVIFLAIIRGWVGWLLAVSTALWLNANLIADAEPYVDGLINAGAIDIAAWQLLFVGGVVLGARATTLTVPTLRVLGVLVACALAFAFLRHSPRLLPPLAAELTDKATLAPLRLVNVALVFYLIALAVRAFPARFVCRPLELLGRHSLAVFTVHVVVAEIVLGLPRYFEGNAVGRGLNNALLIACMFATAFWGRERANARARALQSAAEMTSNQIEQRDREQAPSSSRPEAQEPLRSPMKFFVWIVILFAGVVALGMMGP